MTMHRYPTCTRRSIGLPGVALAAMLAACGGGDGGNVASNPAPMSAPEVRAGTWAVIGSSSAAGAGAAQGKGWVGLLASELGSRGALFANLAKGGTVTYHGVSSMAPAVAGRPLPDPAANVDQALARKPVVLIISYPTNDTALGYGSGETVNNILAMRAQALAAGVPVLVTSSQPRGLGSVQLAQLHDIDQRLAATVGPCFVSLNAALAGPDGKLAPGFDAGDGVHPNGAGHALIAAKVQETLAAKQCVRVLPE